MHLTKRQKEGHARNAARSDRRKAQALLEQAAVAVSHAQAADVWSKSHNDRLEVLRRMASEASAAGGVAEQAVAEVWQKLVVLRDGVAEALVRFEPLPPADASTEEPVVAVLNGLKRRVVQLEEENAALRHRNIFLRDEFAKGRVPELILKEAKRVNAASNFRNNFDEMTAEQRTNAAVFGVKVLRYLLDREAHERVAPAVPPVPVEGEVPASTDAVVG